MSVRFHTQNPYDLLEKFNEVIKVNHFCKKYNKGDDCFPNFDVKGIDGVNELYCFNIISYKNRKVEDHMRNYFYAKPDNERNLLTFYVYPYYKNITVSEWGYCMNYGLLISEFICRLKDEFSELRISPELEEGDKVESW